MHVQGVMAVVAVYTMCGILTTTMATPVTAGAEQTIAITVAGVTGRIPHEPVASASKVEDSEAAADTDMYINGEEDTTPLAQHFFPSFFPSFGGPRPPIYPNSSPRAPLQRSNSNQNANFQPIGFLHRAEPEAVQGNVLGSGNFGVIRGGTFYNDNDRGRGAEFENYQTHSPYYAHNGHGRPSFYKGGGTNPRPQQQRGNDFFANFRDFADINAPTKSSYSELYVVYVNKNASRHEQGVPRALTRGDKPKNIIEQLALIDGGDEEEVYVPKKKSALSPTKLKLARTFKDKQNKAKKYISPKELYEPLLALS